MGWDLRKPVYQGKQRIYLDHTGTTTLLIASSPNSMPPLFREFEVLSLKLLTSPPTILSTRVPPHIQLSPES